MLIESHDCQWRILRRCISDIGCIADLTLVGARALSTNADSIFLHWRSESIIFVDGNMLNLAILSKVFISSHHALIGKRWRQPNDIDSSLLYYPDLAVLDALGRGLLSWLCAHHVFEAGIEVRELGLVVQGWHWEATLRTALVQELGLRRENILLRVGPPDYALLVGLSCIHNVLGLRGPHRHDFHTFTIFRFRSIYLLKITVLKILLNIILILIFTDEIVLLLDSGHLLLLQGRFIVVLIGVLHYIIRLNELSGFLELDWDIFVGLYLRQDGRSLSVDGY